MQKTTNDQGSQNSDSLSIQKTVIKNQNAEATKTYTCSMHPEVMSDKPGKCPKCGMGLIEKNNILIQNIGKLCKGKQIGM